MRDPLDDELEKLRQLKPIIASFVQMFGTRGVLRIEDFYKNPPIGEVGWETIGDDLIVFFREEEDEVPPVS